ncbi:hypothetical protein [Microbacterium sp. MMO-113]|uniref:hypothetical protein n=1 Tax=Microbacterium sp. MMO-113 TaxID=3081273 RepID=UPI003019016E
MSTTSPAAVPVAIALTGSLLPCGVCGVAVPGPHLQRDVTELAIAAVDDPRLGVRELTPQRSLAVTRCAACLGRLERARAAVDAFGAFAARLGSRSLIVERLEAVLAVEGVTGSAVRLESPRDLSTALEQLNVAGAAALWSARFAPVQASDARLGVANASPFAHVGSELRQAARDGLAALLRSRLLRTGPVAVPLGPPADSERRGCLLCGVAASTVWEALTASTRSLGGQPSAAPIEGDVCSACSDALADVGSVGQTSLRRALLQHLGMTRTFALDAIEMTVVGWGALPDGTPPNAEPWAHVDVAALRRDLVDVQERGYVNAGAR